MRFGLVHRIMTNTLAALGVLALVASGQFNRWVSGAIIVGLILALSVRESWQRHPAFRHVDTIALVIVLGVQIGRFLFDENLLDILIEFAAALQVIRLATRRGAAHDQQVIVLALLHLIAGTVLGGGLGYGLCFAGVLIVAPGALVLSHLRREVEGNYRQGARDRTGLPVDVPRILRSRRVVGRPFLAVTCLLSIPIFLFTAALFLVFPRVGLSLLSLSRAHTGRMIGFSGRVDLGEVGVLRSDPTIAARVEIPDIQQPPPPRVTLHLRGTALDHYDGRSWSQSQPGTLPLDNHGGLLPIEEFPNVAADAVMHIDLEPIDPPVIFLPPFATGVRLAPRNQLGLEPSTNAERGPEGEIRYKPTDDRGLKYDVFVSRKSKAAFRRLSAVERPRYLELPSDLPPRVRDLAKEWTAEAKTPLERANAIEGHLRSGYRYDLASPSGRSDQPLDDFLFESKRGHCEFYSTAMAVMLRVVDVPSRNVTGFIGGTYNRFGGFYAVRQGDAHSWVEVYLDGKGWTTFDPTPPSDAAPKSEVAGAWAYLRDFIEAASQRWDHNVVGYDLNQQVSIFQALTSRYRSRTDAESQMPSRGFIGVAGAVLIGGAIGLRFWMRRKRRKEKPQPSPERSPSSIVATALYEDLEGAMSARGVPRGASTPPLRHAQSLTGLAHPLSTEILGLTEIYLRARFGGVAITEDERADFVRRVRALRTQETRRTTSATSS